jgi:hypothetical protein
MQILSYEYARKCDKELERKIRNRHDTRAAAIMQSVAASGTKGFNFFKSTNLETMLFGPEVQVPDKSNSIRSIFSTICKL